MEDDLNLWWRWNLSVLTHIHSLRISSSFFQNHLLPFDIFCFTKPALQILKHWNCSKQPIFLDKQQHEIMHWIHDIQIYFSLNKELVYPRIFTITNIHITCPEHELDIMGGLHNMEKPGVGNSTVSGISVSAFILIT